MRTMMVMSLVALLLAPAAVEADLPAEVYVNGAGMSLEPPARVRQGVAYAPLRAIAEALGAEVTWQEREQRAVLRIAERSVSLARSEGITVQGRLLLPLRKLAEALGAEVEWDGRLNRVTVDTKGSAGAAVLRDSDTETEFVDGQLTPASAAPIPGNGTLVPQISDDFEDSSWVFNYSTNASSNGIWYGSYRGAPKNLARVATPAGGLPGSSGALQMRTDDSDSTPNQDDLCTQVYEALWTRWPVRSDQPSYIARVWMPDFSTWNQGVYNLGMRMEARSNCLISDGNASGCYYPSIWMWYGTSSDAYGPPGPRFVVRMGDGAAPDITVGAITQSGWWTLGIAFDSEGVGHYYASLGVDALTASDKIWDTTQFVPHGGSNAKMDYLAYHFFSLGYPPGSGLTPNFIVDDPSIYLLTPTE